LGDAPGSSDPKQKKYSSEFFDPGRIAMTRVRLQVIRLHPNGRCPHLQQAKRAREGAKALRWVTKELEKRAVGNSSLCPAAGSEWFIRTARMRRTRQSSSKQGYRVEEH